MQRLFSMKYDKRMITNGKPERREEAYFQLMYSDTSANEWPC